ncbi:MAG: hypothetical protein R2742_09205 [Micropruina glycogenica]
MGRALPRASKALAAAELRQITIVVSFVVLLFWIPVGAARHPARWPTPS